MACSRDNDHNHDVAIPNLQAYKTLSMVAEGSQRHSQRLHETHKVSSPHGQHGAALDMIEAL